MLLKILLFWGLKQSSSDRMHYFTNIHLCFLSHYSKDILLFRYGFSLNNLSGNSRLKISGFDYTNDSVIKWGNKLKTELWKIHVKKYKHVLLSGNWFINVMLAKKSILSWKKLRKTLMVTRIFPSDSGHKFFSD